MANTQDTRIVMIVKGIRSELSREEMDRRYRERMPHFRDVPGLLQKFYAHDDATGEWSGIYLWDSQASLDAYLDSDLRKTIGSAYEVTQPPQIEIFPIVDVLRS